MPIMGGGGGGGVDLLEKGVLINFVSSKGVGLNGERGSVERYRMPHFRKCLPRWVQMSLVHTLTIIDEQESHQQKISQFLVVPT